MKIKVPNNGPEWPVDPRFNPVAAFDPNGRPAALTLDADGKLRVSAGGGGGDASAANQATQIAIGEEVRDMAFGRNGAAYISGTTATGGTFGIIHALEDTVIATMTSSSITGTLTNIPLAAGDKIYGTITSITLASGKVLAYNQ